MTKDYNRVEMRILKEIQEEKKGMEAKKGWIINMGVQPDVKFVDVQFENGVIKEGVSPEMLAWNLPSNESQGHHIKAWRPSKNQEAPEYKVSGYDLKILGYDLEEDEKETATDSRTAFEKLLDRLDALPRFRDEIPELMGKVFPESNIKFKEVDFHGDFSKMNKETQDAIINPKHYKIIPAGEYPNGLEYMDICDHALSHLSGVEAHLVGQILKYALRVGKKDAMEQDARKIEWYATRLVNTVKGKN